MKKLILVASLGLLTTNFSLANVEVEKNELKRQIVSLAKSFEGQGDPDFSKQQALEPFVKQLLALSPQNSIEKRLPILAGVWRQVWGPYDYRNDDRGVDPELGVEEIYQVVSPDGYYYNVSYLYKNGDKTRKRIGLLRGEYRLLNHETNVIKVRFTAYRGTTEKSDHFELWQLPELAENGSLPHLIAIVPSFVVRFFFTGGNLREVYTDNDLRIIYGSNNRNFAKESIYIMTRVQ